MTVFFNDTFTEASDTELASHAPDTGNSWTRLWGAPNILAVQASSDTVRVITNINNLGAIYTADATYPSADYEAQITATAMQGAIERPFYMFVRIQDQENMYALRMTDVASGYRLYKKVSGTWTALGTAFTVADGSVVKLQIIGTTLKAFDDGVEVDSVTVTDISAAGKAGIGAGGGDELVNSTDDAISGTAADDFSVTDLGAGETVTFAASATGASSTSDVADVIATRPFSASITGASATPDTVILNTTIFGTAYGEASPTNPEHQAASWATFSDGAGGSPTITGDPDYGLLNLESGNAAHGPVVDFTNQDARIYTLTKNMYGSGSGESIIEIRGDTTVFTQDAATPSWETYSAPINRSWRYVQLRLRKA